MYGKLAEVTVGADRGNAVRGFSNGSRYPRRTPVLPIEVITRPFSVLCEGGGSPATPCTFSEMLFRQQSIQSPCA